MAEPVTETAASWAKPVTLCRISDLFVTGFVFYLIIMNFLLLFLKNYSKMEESSDLCVKVGESGGNDSKERQVTAVNTSIYIMQLKILALLGVELQFHN